jgi:hypothetical protein
MSDDDSNYFNVDESIINDKIPYDYLQVFSPSIEIFEGKLNILSHFQTKAYNPETYKPEAKIKVKNEKDEDEFKSIPHQNYIRWKQTGNELKDIQSNAKIIEWSDGSYQLVVGNQFFDILFTNMANVRYGVKAKDNVSVIGGPISRRMLITKAEDHEVKGETLAYDNEDKTQVKLSYSYFDRNTYKKDEFGSRFNRKRKATPSSATKDNNNLNKKRKRTKKDQKD